MFENTPLLVAPEASCEVASRAIMILVEAQNGIHAKQNPWTAAPQQFIKRRVLCTLTAPELMA